MFIRESLPAQYYYAFLSRKVLPILNRLRITPNQLTWTGFFLALLVPFAFSFTIWSGFFCILLSGIADTMDGLVSRTRNSATLFGAFLDSTLDRAADCLYLIGFWQLFRYSPQINTATSLILASIFLTMLISYVKARAEGLGYCCPGEFMNRTMRILYLLGWASAVAIFRQEQLLWGGLLIYLLLCVISLLQRLHNIRAGLIFQEIHRKKI